MRIYSFLEDAAPCGDTHAVVACGYFDGLHIGHAAVIGRAVKQARQQGLCPAVFTFTMHYGHPQRKPEGCELLTEEEKWKLLEKWGVQLVLAPDFSEFGKLSPEAFVQEILCGRLQAAQVCCGADFRFGAGAAGDTALLAKLCAQAGIRLDLVPEVDDASGSRVSSTRIRTLLGAGEVEQAARLLGRAFGYRFTVVPGKRLGRTIDSPTINQQLPRGFVQLRHGVYASVACADGRFWPSVTNIGLRPTVEDSQAVNSETYLIGYSGDLYGQKVQVRLLRFLRDEQRFPSIEALKAQIQRDAMDAIPIAEGYLAEIYPEEC